MLKSALIAALSVMVIAAASTVAYAIGDNATSCWGPTASVRRALESGTPSDLEIEISKNQKEHRSLFERFKAAPKLLVYGGCREKIQDSALLQIAAISGNVEVVEYLLKSGARPELWQFATCDKGQGLYFVARLIRGKSVLLSSYSSPTANLANPSCTLVKTSQ